jgi:type I restriction enzyme S subunit
MEMNQIKRMLLLLQGESVNQLSIGDFCVESKIRNKDAKVLEVWSVTNKDGLVRTSDYFENVRTSEDTSNYKIVKKDSFVYNPSRINVGSIAFHSQSFDVAVSPMYVVFEVDPKKALPEYLMLFLESTVGKQQILDKCEVGARFRLPFQSLSKIKLFLPSIPVQQEILRVMRTFEALMTQLNAELEARKSQYDFIASGLFQESKLEGTSVLGEVMELKYGYTEIARDEGDLRFLRITDIDQHGKIRSSGPKFITSSKDTVDYLVRSGDLLMARTGATFGKTALIDADENAVFASFLIRLRCNQDVLLPSFYWHYAQSKDYWQQANSLVSMGGQPQFNGNALKQLIVPLPSIETQKSVVKILDSLNSLMNDMTVGLPAEIIARRQQYEYYRNKILTFKILGAA